MIKTYENAERFLKANPDYTEIMKATLIAFETGIVDCATRVLEAVKNGREINLTLLGEIILASEKRTKLLAAGTMRPDLETEPLKETF